MAHLVGAERIRLETPTRVILDELSLGLESGDRIGVVGRNGEGKSTLLGILAGTRVPDDGRVTRRGGVTMGVLDQEDRLGPGTVLDAVVGVASLMDALRGRRRTHASSRAQAQDGRRGAQAQRR